MVPHETLQKLLISNAGAESACRKLVDVANENGGKDNITVIVSYLLSPQVDEARAFVEAEVPLEELTGPNSETSKTVIILEPTVVAKPGAS